MVDMNIDTSREMTP